MSVLDPTTTTTAGDPGDGKAGEPAHVVEVKGGRTPLWRKVFGTWRARIGGGALLLIILWAFVGPYLYHWNAVDSDGLAFGMPPSTSHWFGTNDIGQDIYAQTLVGLQKSLLIGLIAARPRPSSRASSGPSRATSAASSTEPSSGASTCCS